MTQDLAALLASPDAYLHSFDGADAVLAAMDRAAYRRSIFLDRRISPARAQGWRVSAAALAAAAPAAQPMGWIFHVAHCGSTLLARALEELGGGLVLREPLALRQLALAPDPALLPAVLALLSRRYPEGGISVVKANVPVNFMLEPIAAANPAAPAVLLWSRLPDYLTAILRSPNHRAWVRNVTALLAGHLGDLAGLSDAECAAALWAAQHRRFVQALAAMPQARALEAERFFTDPAGSLGAAAGLFDLLAPAGSIDAIVSGPLFSTYSKNPEASFDNAARQSLKQRNACELAGEIAVAERWLAANAADADDMVRRLDSATLLA